MSNITRRDFLKMVVVSATAASTVGLIGCSSDGFSPSTSTTSNTSPFFPQSVASGDPTSSSVIFWTRVLDTNRPSMDLSLVLQVSTTEDFSAGVMQFDDLNALSANDNCLKIKVTSLDPKTTYYYRFVYEDADEVLHMTNVGRTKTAPVANDPLAPEVNYAVLSCQDYIGRYYNTLKRLVELSEEDGNDLDFVVHVGDYIYETTGDADFQNVSGARNITFTDETGVLEITDPLTGEKQFDAAQSLDNYRQLYQVYRADAMLQRVHERFPMISTWDDHEFSDDCHADTATYTDGIRSNTTTDFEQNRQRRINAEQAYFDYMPIEPTTGTVTGGDNSITTDRSSLFPNTTLYRKFNFGPNFDLVVTDFRSNRPDHPIPENGNPGTVVLSNIDLARSIFTAGGLDANPAFVYDEMTFAGATMVTNNVSALTALPSLINTATGVAAGVDQLTTFGFFTLDGQTLTATQEANLRTAVTGAMIAEGFGQIDSLLKANADLAANSQISLIFYDGVATSWNAAVTAGQAPVGSSVIPTAAELVTTILTNTNNLMPADMDTNGIGYGLSYAHFGKQSFFTQFGSRYLVVKDTYDLYNVFKSAVEPITAMTDRDAFDNAFGTDQWDWLFNNALGTSTARYIGIANSVSTSSLVFDFRPDTAGGFLPAASVSNLPAAFQQRFYINADHWDGFPLRKAALLGGIAQVNSARSMTPLGTTSGIFLMAGDIHATYLANNSVSGANIPDFTGPAVSSGSFGGFIEDAFNSVASAFDETAQAAGRQLVVDNLDQGPLDPMQPTKGFLKLSGDNAAASLGGNTLLETRSRQNGFTTFKVTASGMSSTYHLIDESNATTSLYNETAEATAARFTSFTYNFSDFTMAPELFVEPN